MEVERKKRVSILEFEGKFRSNEEIRGFFVLYVFICGGYICYIYICKKIFVLSGECCYRFIIIILC